MSVSVINSEQTEQLQRAILAIANKRPADFLETIAVTPSVNYDNNMRRVCAYMENIILQAGVK